MCVDDHRQAVALPRWNGMLLIQIAHRAVERFTSKLDALAASSEADLPCRIFERGVVTVERQYAEIGG